MKELKRKNQAKILSKKYFTLTCNGANSTAGEAEDFGSIDLHMTVLLKRLYEWNNSISHGSSLLETIWRTLRLQGIHAEKVQ